MGVGVPVYVIRPSPCAQQRDNAIPRFKGVVELNCQDAVRRRLCNSKLPYTPARTFNFDGG
ncbi:hypothetical protein BDN72DRAFT_847319 [Pluteus cervinus]|uniref:Uncharacterized protein n=1 Tax=Pluteus cervinus TaxID=181527 RepID=A0ACD3AEH7_9AGAR|nr:hypothetical protein BDN72DRAFT_847319 [Pluteus cervinus]